MLILFIVTFSYKFRFLWLTYYTDDGSLEWGPFGLVINEIIVNNMEIP